MRLPDFKQPTTKRGLVALLSLLASLYPSEYRQMIVDAGIFVYSMMLILTDEARHVR